MLQRTCVIAGLDPAIQIRRCMAQRNLDYRVSALRAGPAMTK
jgi:hypothetical protein